MFGIGTSEFLVIIIVAVLVLGPEHLPRIVRTVTKIMSDFRRISSEIQRAINLESYLDEAEKEQPTKKKKKKKKKTQTDDSSTITTKNSTDEKKMKSSSDNIKNDNLVNSPSKEEKDESNLSDKESEEKSKI